MLIKQISVFAENKPGRLAEITKVLAKDGIDIRALSIADTTNFGILRLIVNQPEQCEKVLTAAGFTVSQTEVIAVGIEDVPGSFSATLELLASNGIDVNYVYAFLGHSVRACVILRLEDNEKAIEVLKKAGVRIYSAEEVYHM